MATGTETRVRASLSESKQSTAEAVEAAVVKRLILAKADLSIARVAQVAPPRRVTPCWVQFFNHTLSVADFNECVNLLAINRADLNTPIHHEPLGGLATLSHIAAAKVRLKAFRLSLLAKRA